MLSLVVKSENKQFDLSLLRPMSHYNSHTTVVCEKYVVRMLVLLENCVDKVVFIDELLLSTLVEASALGEHFANL